ncbi:hypothetical protein AGLY_015828 [Aphis glycines]|uniref:7TM GPCR serpentine receptor class x (Srx) domain-containing protein n=1 Tax=Aphis glycines TaxID=307491 RepID=A0A6G0T039_APHGL|nr:hypothetical protein AGLY_015828 [Aphis glycines]
MIILFVLTCMNSASSLYIASQVSGINLLIVFFGTRNKNSKLFKESPVAKYRKVTSNFVFALIACLMLVSDFEIIFVTRFKSRFLKSSGKLLFNSILTKFDAPNIFLRCIHSLTQKRLFFRFLVIVSCKRSIFFAKIVAKNELKTAQLSTIRSFMFDVSIVSESQSTRRERHEPKTV